MNDKLRLLSTINNHDTMQVQQDSGVILFSLTHLGNTITVELTPFEAEVLAHALLELAARANVPVVKHEAGDSELENEAPREQAISITRAWLSNQRTVDERIIEIAVAGGGVHRKLRMESGNTILVTEDTWHKEKHIESDMREGVRSHLNIEKDSEGNWWLVDTLPF